LSEARMCATAFLQKNKELVTDLEHCWVKVLSTVVTLILTWLEQLTNWFRPILTCRLLPAATNCMLMIVYKGILL